MKDESSHSISRSKAVQILGGSAIAATIPFQVLSAKERPAITDELMNDVSCSTSEGIKSFFLKDTGEALINLRWNGGHTFIRDGSVTMAPGWNLPIRSTSIQVDQLFICVFHGHLLNRKKAFPTGQYLTLLHSDSLQNAKFIVELNDDNKILNMQFSTSCWRIKDPLRRKQSGNEVSLRNLF